MAQFTITLTDEEEKAALWDIVSIQHWVDNAIRNKSRQCIDEICRQALEDESNTILTTKEKEDVVTALAVEGKIITSVKSLPQSIKNTIVSKARVKSAAERHAEALAAMTP